MAIVTPPNTLVALTHALIIRKKGGVDIGCVNDWTPRQNRDLAEVYEFGNATEPVEAGEPFEIEPGNVRGQQINVRRYDLYTAIIEEIFGDLARTFNSLASQQDPFVLYEEWDPPNNGAGWRWIYSKCWFETIGRTMSTTGDRIVNVDATIRFATKRRVRT